VIDRAGMHISCWLAGRLASAELVEPVALGVLGHRALLAWCLAHPTRAPTLRWCAAAAAATAAAAAVRSYGPVVAATLVAATWAPGVEGSCVVR
jgi:hypothetical protein